MTDPVHIADDLDGDWLADAVGQLVAEVEAYLAKWAAFQMWEASR